MILGIDIGARGAIALLTPTGELVDVFDMPCRADGPIVLPVNWPFKSHAPLSARRIRGRPIHRTTAITTRVRQMTPPAGIQPQKTV